jgi:hypothetical protein
MKETDGNISWGIKKGLEQARLNDIQEIQKMKSSLEEENKKIQVTQAQVLKQEETNKQLQDKISSISNQVVEIEIFEAQVLGIHLKIEEEQQGAFLNMEVIQNYFQETNKSLENILQKEREVKVARTTFQKAVAISTKDNLREAKKLSVSEKIKGDVILKVWEVDLEENKRVTREVNDDWQGIFYLLEKAYLNIAKKGCPGLLGEINIVKCQLRFKEELGEM